MSLPNSQIAKKVITKSRTQLAAANELPSFGRSTSGLAIGSPIWRAPQLVHSIDVIPRTSPQQGQIIESF
jgi:hypothetical protein